MVRPGRAAVEVMLWLGVLAGLGLLMTWWDIRPGSPSDYRPSESFGSRAVLTGSFLLVTAATALFLWLREALPLARLAAAVCGLAMVLGGGPWADTDGAAYVGLLLRVGGVLLWVLCAVSSVWEERAARRPIPTAAAGLLLLGLVPLTGYGLLLLVLTPFEEGLLDADDGSEPGWHFLAPVLLALVVLLPALRLVVTDLVRGRRERVAQVTKNRS